MTATIIDSLPREEAEKLRRVEQPRWTTPMLATLTDERFSDPDWIYERKLDGERVLVFRSNGDTRFLTRNRREINANYPELVQAFDDQHGDFTVDGEIVAFDGKVTSFSRLQQRMQISKCASICAAARRF